MKDRQLEILVMCFYFSFLVTINSWFVIPVTFNYLLLFLQRKIFVKCILDVPNGFYLGFSGDNIVQNMADVDVI